MSDKFVQKDLFMKEEGDQYFVRNTFGGQLIKDDDLIVSTIRSIELAPRKVLEIGCSDGFRLELIRKTFNSDCFGLDPSQKAIESGKIRYPQIDLRVGAADSLPFGCLKFDMIIFGFCLYLCDRSDLFKIAYEADKCLCDNGSLIIKDFCPPFPYKNKYTHREGVFSYKMDYSKMFTWNPAYCEIAKIISSHSGFKLRDIPDEKVGVVVLRKNENVAYLENPFG